MAEEQTSPEAGSSPAEAAPDTAPVTAEQGSDRPEKNWVAEFKRKQERQAQQLDAVLQWIATQQQPQRVTPAPQPAAASGQVSDDDLWAAAQGGDRQAFELYQQRIADRRISEQLTAQNRQQLVMGQLNALVGRYPVLRDPSHPLTQTVNQAYALLVQQGYPTGQATLLEAAKTAIADRPDLVAELHTAGAQAREQSRRTATQTAQAGVTGASHRQDASPRQGNVRQITRDEAALARRMGVSDPAKAKERFLKRQEAGQSALGAVSGYINAEDL